MTAASTERAARVEPVPRRDPLARLGALVDPDTLVLLHDVDDSGAVAARGRIDGLPVCVFATDPAVKGGAMGRTGCGHIVHAIDTAVREHVPVVGVWHSGGARLAEGVAALDAVGTVFTAIVRASGRVPQISVVVGPAAGGAAYGPALTDVVIMSDEARVFVTGPEVVRDVTGEQVDTETLGGPALHGRRSGVAHLVTADEQSAFAAARRVTALLAVPGNIDPSGVPHGVDLGSLLPREARRAYDVKPLVNALLDEPGLELHQRWAPNIVTVLGRFGGRAVGVVANNPIRQGGCLDTTSADKAARFVRLCDAFGLPLIVLVDVPGYLPGLGQEVDGVVRRGAKLLHAFAEAVVPRVTLITRKAFGGAFIAMNSRSLGATAVFAWPDAEVAVMGADAAVTVLHRKRLAAVPEAERDGLRAAMVAEHKRVAGGVERALELGVVDDIVLPDETHKRLAAALYDAPRSCGVHGNIPL